MQHLLEVVEVDASVLHAVVYEHRLQVFDFVVREFERAHHLMLHVGQYDALAVGVDLQTQVVELVRQLEERVLRNVFDLVNLSYFPSVYMFDDQSVSADPFVTRVDVFYFLFYGESLVVLRVVSSVFLEERQVLRVDRAWLPIVTLCACHGNYYISWTTATHWPTM